MEERARIGRLLYAGSSLSSMAFIRNLWGDQLPRAHEKKEAQGAGSLARVCGPGDRPQGSFHSQGAGPRQAQGGQQGVGGSSQVELGRHVLLKVPATQCG